MEKELKQGYHMEILLQEPKQGQKLCRSWMRRRQSMR